jgi:hypothetical protein
VHDLAKKSLGERLNYYRYLRPESG